jgi:perosamine synthetase
LTAATRQIPLSRPYLDEREEELVLEVLRSGRLSLGPAIERFEELFAERVGAPYAAAVSSGTAGLHLLCRLAGLGPGDEVITSPYSFAASANCFIYEGAAPVFADVDSRALNLDPAAVEAAVTERTRAVVAVDIFGYPCELDPLRELCDRHGLVLIQDACEALGAEYRGAPVGSHGPSAVFAFYPNKQITTGEGGMVTTHSEEERRLLVSLRNQGRADGGGWLEHARLGFNYRIDDVRAALGIGQLEKLDRILALRREAAQRYVSMLSSVEGVEVPHADDAEHRRSWFVFVVALAEGVDREAVVASLERAGVQTARYLPCIHLQPYMRDRYGFGEGLCPVAEEAARRTLALPFFTAIAPADQDRVVEALAAAVRI